MSARQREAQARTERLCRADPFAAALRTTLLEQEALLHSGGWDTNGLLTDPRVFVVVGSTEDPSLAEFRWHPGFTTTVAQVAERVGRGPGDGLLALAAAVEGMRTQGVPAEVSPDGVATAPPLPQDDLVEYKPPRRFHGIGVFAEAWKVTRPEAEMKPWLATRALDQHPARQEVRVARFVGRDAMLWTVERRRSAWPTVTAEPMDERPATGTVVHALARFVNAVAAGATVPVPPVSADGDSLP